MNKNIRTIFWANETISLRVFEPFHRANHFLLLVDVKQNPPEADSMENAVRAFEVAPHAVNYGRLSDQPTVEC